MIVACGPLPSGGLVYAVAVTQPVQSWTVLRDHNDFVAMARSLSEAVPGLPQCPSLGPTSGNAPVTPNLATIVKPRNELQQWLTTILMNAHARETVCVREFLTVGANTIPPQYEGLPWTQFNTVMHPLAPHSSPQHNNSSGGFDRDVDDMDMAYMFEGEDETAISQDDHDDDEDYIPSASERYKLTEEAVTDEDEMEIMQLAGDNVEMIDDIGSLAQSLGASHLGRSLNLQAEMKHSEPGSKTSTAEPVQGLHVGGASGTQGGASGGLGSAMAKAAGSGISGLSDSFNQRPPQSAPKLDSFKMIKVIGKGSFGKGACRLFLSCMTALTLFVLYQAKFS